MKLGTIALLLLLLGATPTLAQPTGRLLAGHADFVCPTCPADVVTMSATEVMVLIVSTVLENGVSLLLVGATAAVGLPWVIAGIAIAIIYLPRWLKVT